MIIKKIINYFKESFDELKKVQWPSRETTMAHSLIVMISVLIGTVVFGLIDYGFQKVVDHFILGS